jgi:small GTP-binding protein
MLGSVSAYARYRVVVIGNTQVGKTSILNQLISSTFHEHEPPTLGANFQIRIEDVNGTKVEIQIWDTAGQEKYRSLSPVYYRNSSGAIVVYDVTNRQSFDDMPDWITAFTGVAEPNSSIIIVGNKSDLSGVQVPIDQAKSWAAARDYELIITSAKTGDGIEQLFHKIGKILVGKPQARYKAKVDFAEPKNEGGCPC